MCGLEMHSKTSSCRLFRWVTFREDASETLPFRSKKAQNLVRKRHLDMGLSSYKARERVAFEMSQQRWTSRFAIVNGIISWYIGGFDEEVSSTLLRLTDKKRFPFVATPSASQERRLQLFLSSYQKPRKTAGTTVLPTQ